MLSALASTFWSFLTNDYSNQLTLKNVETGSCYKEKRSPESRAEFENVEFRYACQADRPVPKGLRGRSGEENRLHVPEYYYPRSTRPRRFEEDTSSSDDDDLDSSQETVNSDSSISGSESSTSIGEEGSFQDVSLNTADASFQSIHLPEQGSSAFEILDRPAAALSPTPDTVFPCEVTARIPVVNHLRDTSEEFFESFGLSTSTTSLPGAKSPVKKLSPVALKEYDVGDHVQPNVQLATASQELLESFGLAKPTTSPPAGIFSPVEKSSPAAENGVAEHQPQPNDQLATTSQELLESFGLAKPTTSIPAGIFSSVEKSSPAAENGVAEHQPQPNDQLATTSQELLESFGLAKPTTSIPAGIFSPVEKPSPAAENGVAEYQPPQPNVQLATASQELLESFGLAKPITSPPAGIFSPVEKPSPAAENGVAEYQPPQPNDQLATTSQELLESFGLAKPTTSIPAGIFSPVEKPSPAAENGVAEYQPPQPNDQLATASQELLESFGFAKPTTSIPAGIFSPVEKPSPAAENGVAQHQPPQPNDQLATTSQELLESFGLSKSTTSIPAGIFGPVEKPSPAAENGVAEYQPPQPNDQLATASQELLESFGLAKPTTSIPAGIFGPVEKPSPAAENGVAEYQPQPNVQLATASQELLESFGLAKPTTSIPAGIFGPVEKPSPAAENGVAEHQPQPNDQLATASQELLESFGLAKPTTSIPAGIFSLVEKPSPAAENGVAEHQPQPNDQLATTSQELLESFGLAKPTTSPPAGTLSPVGKLFPVAVKENLVVEHEPPQPKAPPTVSQELLESFGLAKSTTTLPTGSGVDTSEPVEASAFIAEAIEAPECELEQPGVTSQKILESFGLAEPTGPGFDTRDPVPVSFLQQQETVEIPAPVSNPSPDCEQLGAAAQGTSVVTRDAVDAVSTALPPAAQVLESEVDQFVTSILRKTSRELLATVEPPLSDEISELSTLEDKQQSSFELISKVPEVEQTEVTADKLPESFEPAPPLSDEVSQLPSLEDNQASSFEHISQVPEVEQTEVPPLSDKDPELLSLEDNPESSFESITQELEVTTEKLPETYEPAPPLSGKVSDFSSLEESPESSFESISEAPELELATIEKLPDIDHSGEVITMFNNSQGHDFFDQVPNQSNEYNTNHLGQGYNQQLPSNADLSNPYSSAGSSPSVPRQPAQPTFFGTQPAQGQGAAPSSARSLMFSPASMQQSASASHGPPPQAQFGAPPLFPTSIAPSHGLTYPAQSLFPAQPTMQGPLSDSFAPTPMTGLPQLRSTPPSHGPTYPGVSQSVLQAQSQPPLFAQQPPSTQRPPPTGHSGALPMFTSPPYQTTAPTESAQSPITQDPPPDPLASTSTSGVPPSLSTPRSFHGPPPTNCGQPLTQEPLPDPYALTPSTEFPPSESKQPSQGATPSGQLVLPTALQPPLLLGQQLPSHAHSEPLSQGASPSGQLVLPTAFQPLSLEQQLPTQFKPLSQGANPSGQLVLPTAFQPLSLEKTHSTPLPQSTPPSLPTGPPPAHSAPLKFPAKPPPTHSGQSLFPTTQEPLSDPFVPTSKTELPLSLAAGLPPSHPAFSPQSTHQQPKVPPQSAPPKAKTSTKGTSQLFGSSEQNDLFGSFNQNSGERTSEPFGADSLQPFPASNQFGQIPPHSTPLQSRPTSEPSSVGPPVSSSATNPYAASRSSRRSYASASTHTKADSVAPLQPRAATHPTLEPETSVQDNTAPPMLDVFASSSAELSGRQDQTPRGISPSTDSLPPHAPTYPGVVPETNAPESAPPPMQDVFGSSNADSTGPQGSMALIEQTPDGFPPSTDASVSTQGFDDNQRTIYPSAAGQAFDHPFAGQVSEYVPQFAPNAQTNQDTKTSDGDSFDHSFSEDSFKEPDGVDGGYHQPPKNVAPSFIPQSDGENVSGPPFSSLSRDGPPPLSSSTSSATCQAMVPPASTTAPTHQYSPSSQSHTSRSSTMSQESPSDHVQPQLDSLRTFVEPPVSHKPFPDGHISHGEDVVHARVSHAVPKSDDVHAGPSARGIDGIHTGPIGLPIDNAGPTGPSRDGPSQPGPSDFAASDHSAFHSVPQSPRHSALAVDTTPSDTESPLRSPMQKEKEKQYHASNMALSSLWDNGAQLAVPGLIIPTAVNQRAPTEPVNQVNPVQQVLPGQALEQPIPAVQPVQQVLSGSVPQNQSVHQVTTEQPFNPDKRTVQRAEPTQPRATNSSALLSSQPAPLDVTQGQPQGQTRDPWTPDVVPSQSQHYAAPTQPGHSASSRPYPHHSQHYAAGVSNVSTDGALNTTHGDQHGLPTNHPTGALQPPPSSTSRAGPTSQPDFQQRPAPYQPSHDSYQSAPAVYGAPSSHQYSGAARGSQHHRPTGHHGGQLHPAGDLPSSVAGGQGQPAGHLPSSSVAGRHLSGSTTAGHLPTASVATVQYLPGSTQAHASQYGGPEQQPAGHARQYGGPEQQPAHHASHYGGPEQQPAGHASQYGGQVQAAGHASQYGGPEQQPAGHASQYGGPEQQPAHHASQYGGPEQQPAGHASQYGGQVQAAGHASQYGGPEQQPAGHASQYGGPEQQPAGHASQYGGPEQQPDGHASQYGGPEQQPAGHASQYGGPEQQPAGHASQYGGPEQQPAHHASQYGGPEQQQAGHASQYGGPEQQPAGHASQYGGPEQQPAHHASQYGGPEQQPAGHASQYGGPEQQPTGHASQYGGPEQQPAHHASQYGGPEQQPAHHASQYGGPEQQPARHASQYGGPEQQPARHASQYGGPEQQPAGHASQYGGPEQQPAGHASQYGGPEQQPAGHASQYGGPEQQPATPYEAPYQQSHPSAEKVQENEATSASDVNDEDFDSGEECNRYYDETGNWFWSYKEDCWIPAQEKQEDRRYDTKYSGNHRSDAGRYNRDSSKDYRDSGDSRDYRDNGEYSEKRSHRRHTPQKQYDPRNQDVDYRNYYMQKYYDDYYRDYYRRRSDSSGSSGNRRRAMHSGRSSGAQTPRSTSSRSSSRAGRHSRHSSRRRSRDYDYEDGHSRRRRDGGSSRNSRRRSSTSSGSASSETNSSDSILGDRYSGHHHHHHKKHVSEYHIEKVPTPERLTPKQHTAPHVICKFAGASIMCLVPSKHVVEGEHPDVVVAQVKKDASTYDTLASFPGPLRRGDTHKRDVIKFAREMALTAYNNRSRSFEEREASFILWEVLAVMVQLNGVYHSSDIAEVLTADLPDQTPVNYDEHRTSPRTRRVSFDEQTDYNQDFLATYREYLMCGKTNEALEFAINAKMWGHALTLSYQLDAKTFSRVMSRFTGHLDEDDSLLCLYQHLSQRQPSVLQKNTKSWRKHLAMMIANPSTNHENDQQNIFTLGQNLETQGIYEAAHLCYLLAGRPICHETGMILIGSNLVGTKPEFVDLEAIQRTEIYEYAMTLRDENQLISDYQAWKILYANSLAEVGLHNKAFRYCEVMLDSVMNNPAMFSKVVICQLRQLSVRLHQQVVITHGMDMVDKLQQLNLIQDAKEGECSGDGQASDQAASGGVGAMIPGHGTRDVHHAGQRGDDQNSVNSETVQTAHNDATPAAAVPTMFVPTNTAATTDNLQQHSYPDVAKQPDTAMSRDMATYNAGYLPQTDGNLTQDPYDVNYGVSTADQMTQGAYNASYTPSFQGSEQMSYSDVSVTEAQAIGYQETIPSRQPSEVHFFGGPSSGTGNEYYEGDSFEHLKVQHSETSLVGEDIAQQTSQTAFDYYSHYESSADQNMGSTKNEADASKEEENKENKKVETKDEKKDEKAAKSKQGSGWSIGGFIKSFIPKGKNEIKLPDDTKKTIYFDKKLGRWVNTEETEEDKADLPPPPIDPSMMSGAPSTARAPGPPSGAPTPPSGAPPVNATSSPSTFSSGSPARTSMTPATASTRGPAATPQAPVAASSPAPFLPEQPENSLVNSPLSTPSRFSRRALGSKARKSNYVDVLGSTGSTNKLNASPMLFQPFPTQTPVTPAALPEDSAQTNLNGDADNTQRDSTDSGPAAPAVPFFNPADYASSTPSSHSSRLYPKRQ